MEVVMNKQIWKYELEPINKLKLPKGAEVLSAHEQFGKVCIWVLVDPTEEKEERIFEVYPTGSNIHYDMGTDRTYIGTTILVGGTLVFHVFEYTGI